MYNQVITALNGYNIVAYGLGHDTIDKIVERLEAKGMNYGEHADITPAVVRQILEKSL